MPRMVRNKAIMTLSGDSEMRLKMKKSVLTYTGGNDPRLAQAWIENLIKEMNLNFHPDTRAEEYINRTTLKPTFSKAEAKKLNHSINELFRLFGDDVYRISLLAIGLEA